MIIYPLLLLVLLQKKMKRRHLQRLQIYSFNLIQGSKEKVMKIIGNFLLEAICKFKLEFLKAVFMSVLLSLSNLAIIIIFKLFLTHLSDELYKLALYVFMLCLALLVSTLIHIVWSICLDKLGGKYIAYLVDKCQKTISNTKFEYIDAAKIDHQLYADILNIFRVIGNFIPNLLCSIILLSLLIIFSLTIDNKITLFLFFATIIGIFLSYLSKKIIITAASNTNSKLQAYHSILHEYTDKIAYIQANLLSPYYAKKTQHKINEFISSSVQEDKKIYFFNSLTQNYNYLMQFLLSLFLSLPLYKNSLPNLAFYMVLFSFLMAKGETVELLFQQIQRNVVCFKNINDILQLPIDQGEQMVNRIHSIKIHKLKFRYNTKTEYLFNSFNLQLECGDFVLLKGQNGTGKSTLLHLLLDQYTPSSGHILINDIALSKLNKEDYYRQIVYISQTEPLFNVPMQEYLNILSASSYTDTEIANITNMFNISYMPTITESEISGGEKKENITC